MTVKQVVLEAAAISGLTLPDEIPQAGITYVNTTLMDMGLEVITSLDDEPSLPTPTHHRALISGVARYLCRSIGDSRAESAAEAEYLRELAVLKAGISLVRDTLPKGEYC